MTVIIINPNSTASMTDAMVQTANMAVPHLQFDGWTSAKGPASIEGEADGLAAAGPLLEMVREAEARGASGVVIGCFDDTALSEAASLVSCPVVGIGQASFHFAALRNWSFSVVTTVPESVPIIEKNIHDYGLGKRVRRVRAAEIAVLDLEHDFDAAAAKVLAEAHLAEAEDEVDAIVLGCAGMVRLSEIAKKELGVPVIDPVVAATSSMKWMI